jgi:hypothetical protein
MQNDGERKSVCRGEEDSHSPASIGTSARWTGVGLPSDRGSGPSQIEIRAGVPAT